MSRVVLAARGWIGTPYLHQASFRGAGSDCLGLVRGIWREVIGDEPQAIPPYTRDWAEPARTEDLADAIARWLDPADEVTAAMPGAVLLFRMRDLAMAKHLGILTVSGDAPWFVHAYSGRGVVESPLSLPWQRRIAGAFRFPGQ